MRLLSAKSGPVGTRQPSGPEVKLNKIHTQLSSSVLHQAPSQHSGQSPHTEQSQLVMHMTRLMCDWL